MRSPHQGSRSLNLSLTSLCLFWSYMPCSLSSSSFITANFWGFSSSTSQIYFAFDRQPEILEPPSQLPPSPNVFPVFRWEPGALCSLCSRDRRMATLFFTGGCHVHSSCHDKSDTVNDLTSCQPDVGVLRLAWGHHGQFFLWILWRPSHLIGC